MISTTLVTIVGAAIGAITMGATAAVTGHAPGLDVALQHIPGSTHAFDMVTTLVSAGVGGGAGGGVGATVASVAKSLAKGAGVR